MRLAFPITAPPCLARDEMESPFRNELLRQAAAYRKLAAKRAADYGLPPPIPPGSHALSTCNDAKG
jgi:hypothetical protein